MYVYHIISQEIVSNRTSFVLLTYEFILAQWLRAIKHSPSVMKSNSFQFTAKYCLAQLFRLDSTSVFQIMPQISMFSQSSRADSRLAPSQWKTSLQSNAVSHWLGANLETALSCVWRTYHMAYSIQIYLRSLRTRKHQPHDPLIDQWKYVWCSLYLYGRPTAGPIY